MKKIIHHPITIVALLVLFILVFAFCGFRITYNPSLDNNWDAVAACASCASVVVSGLAIWYAIQVPKKIAEEQNRIALFEKRHTFYMTFCQCISFSDGLSSVNTIEEARRMFYVMFCDNLMPSDEESLGVVIANLQIKTISIMSQGTYLFPFLTDKLLEDFLNHIINATSIKNSPTEFAHNCQQVQESAAVMKEQIIPKIEQELKLSQ